MLSQEKTEGYYYKKVTKPQSSQDLIEGYRYYKNVKEESKQEQDTTALVYALNMITISQMGIGAYYDAESSAVEALETMDNYNGDPATIKANRKSAYANLSIIYNNLEKRQEAIGRFKDALAFAENAKDSSNLYNNIGASYAQKKDYANANTHFKLAYERITTTTDTLSKAIVLDNWGATQAKLNNPDGFNNLKIALRLKKRIKAQSYLYSSYKHLSEYYKDLGEEEISRMYADSGLTVAEKYSAQYRQDALYNKLSLNSDPDLTAYLKLNDSIAIAKLLNENKYASAKYNLNIEKEEKERALLQSAVAKSKTRTYQFIVILIIIAATSLLIILIIRHRKKQIEQVYITETRISKRVHDEVANDIYRIMVKLQTSPTEVGYLMDDLDRIYNKTRDISRENNMINVAGDFRQLLNDLFLSYKSPTLNIITKYDGQLQWDEVSDLKKMTIYRVLQELITNTKKHSQAGIALIDFSKTGKKIAILYKDNGEGGMLKSKNGLQNVETRIEALNGTITFNSEANKGFTALITI
ncbi:tetratricopeptide repeat-containing sensor histidine kinase [Dokdonia sinensis]|uniref:tetratricopeptide repeat-containing sensor histidine kinase n=1 Tax=Dokdonia sinensis TaxID=2479847 RepID=UPI0011C3960E|nr:ATP-binding protein [Dokdonia sinensis]